MSCFARPVPVNSSSWLDASKEWFDFSKTHGTVITRGDRELWVHRILQGSDTTIFFIHGAGGRAEQWFEQIKILREKKVNIIIPELLGHGRSSKPVGDSLYATPALVSDVECIIDTFQTARNIIIGHSLGSAITMHLASRKKVKVDSIVLLGTGYASPPGTNHPLWKCSLCCLNILRPLFSAASKKSLYHSSVSENFLNTQARITNQNSFHVMKPLIRGMVWPTKDAITSIAIPSLIIQGDSDLVFKDVKALAQHLPTTELRVLEKAGHNLMMEQPELVTQVIWEFVERYQGTKSASVTSLPK